MRRIPGSGRRVVNDWVERLVAALVEQGFGNLDP